MRKLAYLAAALLAVSACTASPASNASGGTKADSPAATAPQRDGGPVWKLKWQANFAESAPLGSFSGCNNYDRTPAAYCSALPADLRSQWWAYPYPWPDSATEVHKPLGGYYDPAHTVWISGGQMHIRMFRTTTWIHSAAVVPKASIGMLYGKYVERFMVTPDSDPGYGGAHLLWPTSTPIDYEVDFPEGDWDYNFCLHVHSIPEGTKTRDLCPDVKWTQWNTTEIDWWPGNVAFYLNGQLIYHVTGKWVPDEPMSWIIQNQAALKAPWAAENSAAQLNLSYVAVYSYAGEQG
jgi:hypothetical protein